MTKTLNIQPTEVKDYAESSYLAYAMYVILDRALPHIGDGMKPVQRRIIYAMSELGLNHTAKYKKSARTVGDVLGKFHPHGDSACYEAMVLMAQPFSYRYPLVDGQGNWGSIDDPKSFAAMRYTESKLAAYSNTLLSELKQGTVDRQPNFDGTLTEPVVLPSQLPNILINGGTGIAVGMATDIPPHNLREVVNATIALIDKPGLKTADLMEFIQGPDFPTEAQIITPKSELVAAYESGNGRVKMRAKYHSEDNNIVVTALPFKISGEKLLEKLADLMRNKKLPMIDDLRDESDHEFPTRILLKVKRGTKIDHDRIMRHLFSISDLESGFNINLNMIGLNNLPQVKGLSEILSEWIIFRKQTVRRRLQHGLDKINRRLHLIEALFVVYLNLDEVIRIIREDKDPKAALIEKFDLSEIQSDYILDTRLRNLARLEEIQLTNEQSDLEKEANKITLILGSEKRLSTLIKKELLEATDVFGDDRVSPLKEGEPALPIDINELLPTEPVSVILSENGWIRSAKGHTITPEALSYRAGDGFRCLLKSQLNQQTTLFDNTGRSYQINNQKLPSARSHGEAVSTMIDHPSGASILTLLPSIESGKYIMASGAGYGFICPAIELSTRNKKGKAILSCKAHDALSPVLLDESHSHVAIGTENGILLVFQLSELPELKKGKGNKLIGLSSGDRIKSIATLNENDALMIVGRNKEERLTPAKWKAHAGRRGLKGKPLPKTFGPIISLSQA